MGVRSQTWSCLIVLFIGLLTGGQGQGDSGKPCSEKYTDSMRGFGTRLQYAVRAGDLQCAKEFLDAGDDINRWDRFGVRAVGDATFDGNLDMVKLLYEYGAELDVGQNDFGSTLAMASCKGHVDIVMFLVDVGSDKSMKNGKGETPKDVACTCVTDGSGCDSGQIVGLLEETTSAVLFNTDLPSGEFSPSPLNDGRSTITDSNRECWELCAKTPGCKSWTRIKRGLEGGSRKGECWLRSFIPASKACTHCDSGLSSCSVLNNGRYTSDDDVLNDGKTTLTSSNAECCALCNERSDCKNWTRIKVDTQYNKEGECWLRSGASNPEYWESSDSGSKF